MRLSRPNWLTRLQGWREEVSEEITGLLVGAGVFALLAFLLHSFSTTVGEDYQSLVAIPAGCFVVIAAICALGLIVKSFEFMVSAVVYYPINMSYCIVRLLLISLKKLSIQFNRLLLSLLALLKKLLIPTRSVLLRPRLAVSPEPYMEESRIITSVLIFLLLCIPEFLREKDREVFDVLYLLIASGVVTETISPVIRPTIATLWKRLARPPRSIRPPQ